MTEETIFAAALDLPPADRAAYLAGACGTDSALRKRLEGLLNASDRAGGFMARPAVAPPQPADARTEVVEEPVSPNAETVSRAGSEKPADDDEVPLGFLAPAERPGSLGRIGHYEVLQILGKGGFGIVFRAFDDVLQRVVAVKVLAPQLAATSPARKRFLREARSSAQVRHENVVQVYEIGEQPLPYLAMEFIPGETLQQRLERTGPLEVVEVVRVGRQIAEGLAAAHATDLIHRDIKPGNILLEGAQHKVKITDFGLARAADDASISQSGIIAGTPMYMAPEQAKGEKLDQRADLFSLGTVLYQMAAGRPPFRANGTVAVLKRVAEDTPRDIREIIPETPQWLCAVIAKLHAKDPADRFQSAREVADVLADCEAQLKAHSKLKDYSRIPRGQSRRSGRRRLVAAAAVLLLPVIALAVTEGAGVTHLLREPTPGAAGAANGDPEAAGKDAPVQAERLAGDAPVDDAIAAFTAGDKPPAKDLFPGRPFTWAMFDDPAASSKNLDQRILNPSADLPNWKRKIENGLSVTTFHMPDARSFPFPVWFPVPTADLALAVRFRCENAVANLTVREWPDGDGKQTLVFHLGVDGSWGVFRYVWKDSTHVRFRRALATSDGPDSALANGRWVTLAVRVSGRVGEVWANGRRLARMGDAGPEPGVGAARKSMPFEGRPGVEGAGRYEIAYLAVWDLTVLPFTDADARRIAALPAGQQIKAVLKELATRNPGYVVGIRPTIDAGVVTGLYLSGRSGALADLSPLRGMKLTALSVQNEPQLRDLEPLRGMPLESLDLWGWTGSDLTPLRGMPLKWLNCGGGLQKLDFSPLAGSPLEYLCINHTRVTSLATLKNVPLKALCCADTSVSDLSPLKDLPLTELYCEHSKVSDLSPLKGKPLKFLHIEDTGVSDLTPLEGVSLEGVRLTPKNITKGLDLLRGMKSLKTIGIASDKAWPAAEFWQRFDKGEFGLPPFSDADAKRIAALPAERQVEEVRKELVRRNPGFGGDVRPTIERGVVTGLDFSPQGKSVADLSPLRGMKLTHLNLMNHARVENLEPLRGMPLEWLDLWGWGGSDLTPLHGMPLKWLNCGGGGQTLDFTPLAGSPLEYLCINFTQVTSLATLKDVPLKTLLCESTPVSDLSPLKDLPLETLHCYGTKVSDLSPLKGKPLKVLGINSTGITDLTPLQGMPLEDVRLTPRKITKGLDLLRGMKSLKKIGIDFNNNWPAAEFWKRYDKGEFTQAASPDRRAAEYVLSVGGKIGIDDQDRVVEAAADLPAGPFRLTAVHLSNNQRIDDAGLAALDGCKDVTILDLDNSWITDAGLAHFKDCRNLRKLELAGTGVTDTGVACFKGCTTLTYLSLYQTPVSEAALAYFKDNKGLKVLSLTNVSDKGLSNFQDCKDLTFLVLNSAEVTDAGVAYFKDCKGLENLQLAKTRVTDAGLAYFKGARLKVLTIQHTNVTDLTPLQGMPLEEIWLTPKTIAKGLDLLRGMASLKKIGTDGNQALPAAEFWRRYDAGEFKK